MLTKGNAALTHRHYEEKHIFLLTPCIHTALGIEELCASYAGWRLCGVARTIPELKKMLNRHHVDMLIVEAGYAAIDISLLRQLSQQLEGRIILMMDETSSSLQEVYRIAGINIAVSKSLPLTVFQSLLHWMMYAPRETLQPQFYNALQTSHNKTP